MGDLSIELIRNDLLAFDFNEAEELGITITGNTYDKFSQQDWSISTDGKLYLNKSINTYKLLLGAFTKLAETSLEEIENIFKTLNEYYPNDNDFPDINKYDHIDHKKNIILKVLIPVELSKRKNGEKVINGNVIRIFTRL